MKRWTWIIFLLLFFWVNMGQASATDSTSDIVESQADALDVEAVEDALSRDAADIMDGLSITEGLDFDTGLSTVVSAASSQSNGIFKEALQSAVLILGIALLCRVVGLLYENGSSLAIPNYVPMAGTLGISAVAVLDVRTFMGLGTEIIGQLDIFSKALLPTLAAAATANGAITSGTAKYMATALFVDILISIADNILMPVIYAYIAACIANAALGGETLAGVANLLKWIAVTILTGIVLVFVTYLTISGVVASTADATATRLAKSAISTAFPIVGSILSDAASAIAAGAGLLKNAIGIFGMLAIIAICLIPFLRLGIHYLIYKVTAGLTGAVAEGRLSKLVSSMGNAFGMMLGLTGSCAVMLFFSILSVMKVVGG